MNNVNKELPKALTIEDLKNRVGKPVFVIAATEEFKNKTAWYVLSKINEYKLDNESNGYVEFTMTCGKPTPLGVGWIALNTK